MLYREPNTRFTDRFLLRTRGFLAGLLRGRRRQLTEIDLRTMNPYLRQDLGLEDVGLFRR